MKVGYMSIVKFGFGNHVGNCFPTVLLDDSTYKFVLLNSIYGEVKGSVNIENCCFPLFLLDNLIYKNALLNSIWVK